MRDKYIKISVFLQIPTKRKLKHTDYKCTLSKNFNLTLLQIALFKIAL